MDTPTANVNEMMQDRVKALREGGDLAEAMHAANAAVEKCQRSLGGDLDSIDAFVNALEVRAGLRLELGEYELALDDGREAIGQLDGRPDRNDQLGRLYAQVGVAYDELGMEEMVVSSWEAAVGFFEKCEPPMKMDVAGLGNNLGFMAKAAGDLDRAEDYFLKSLEIMMSEVGQGHEKTASVCNNLGAVYLAAGYLEQAREMHMMALETRREVFGEHHPDTAQSHNNLALALLRTGDRTWARRHFEKALAGFEALGEGYREDLEAVASNYCGFLEDEGEGGLSEVIAGRVKELLGGV